MTFRYILLLLLPSVATAQTACQDLLIRLDHAVVQFQTKSDMGRILRQPCVGTFAQGDTITRIIYDSYQQPFFGYEIRITALGNDRYRAEMGAIRNSRLRSFSSFPAPVTVSAYDFLDVPVLEQKRASARESNVWLDFIYWQLVRFGLLSPPPKGPERPGRVVDYLSIHAKGKPSIAFPAFRNWAKMLPEGTALALDRPRVRRTYDYSENAVRSEFGVIGPVVWIYWEGNGRFLFSATPRVGYRRAGVTDNAMLRFSVYKGGVVGEAYEIGLRSSVVSQPGPWWVWVKHEPDFKVPAGPWTAAELKRGMPAIGLEK